MGLEDDASFFCLFLAGFVPSLPADLNNSKIFHNQCRHQESQCQPQNAKDFNSRCRVVRHAFQGNMVRGNRTTLYIPMLLSERISMTRTGLWPSSSCSAQKGPWT